MTGAFFESILGYNVSKTANSPEKSQQIGVRKPSAFPI